MNTQISTAIDQHVNQAIFTKIGDWLKGAYIAAGFKARVYFARNEKTGDMAVIKIGTNDHGLKEKEVLIMEGLPTHLLQSQQLCAEDVSLNGLSDALDPSLPTYLFSTTGALSTYTEKKKLLVLYQLLEAVDALQQNGVTHGDIHERNIAFVDQQLVIIDFGEANLADIATWDAKTGARFETGKAWKLAAKDVRRCGWVALWLWGFTPSCYNPHFNPDRNQVRGKWLREFAPETPENLIYRLTGQNPNDQPTAGEALRHACFKGMTPLSPKGVPQCLASREGGGEISKTLTSKHVRFASVNIPFINYASPFEMRQRSGSQLGPRRKDW